MSSIRNNILAICFTIGTLSALKFDIFATFHYQHLLNAKLTNSRVTALAPRSKAYEIYDSEVPGFLVRAQPSGRKTYYAAYPLRDQPRRLAVKCKVLDRYSGRA